MERNRKWNYDEKIEIIKKHLNGESISQLRKKYHIKSTGSISSWKRRYLDGSLKDKPKGRKKMDKDMEYEILKKSYALLMEIRSKQNK